MHFDNLQDLNSLVMKMHNSNCVEHEMLKIFKSYESYGIQKRIIGGSAASPGKKVQGNDPFFIKSGNLILSTIDKAHAGY